SCQCRPHESCVSRCGLGMGDGEGIPMANNPLVLRFPDSKRSEALLDLLEGGKLEFTTIVSTKDTPVHRFDTAFLGLSPGRVDYVARISAGAKMATFERRISLFDFVEVDLAIDEWAQSLSGQRRDRL